MENIFENAKFGDKFKTRDGRMTIYLKYWEFGDFPYDLIIDDEWGPLESSCMSNGFFNADSESPYDIVSRWEE